MKIPFAIRRRDISIGGKNFLFLKEIMNLKGRKYISKSLVFLKKKNGN